MLYLQRNVDQVHGKTKRTTGWLSRTGLLEERLRELGLPYRGGKHERGSAQHSISGTACKDVKDLFRKKKNKERIWGKCIFHVPDGYNKQYEAGFGPRPT